MSSSNLSHRDLSSISSGFVSSPLPLQLIDSPPIFRAEWESATRHPIGYGFVAVCIERQIYIWAGYQHQPGGRDPDLPTNFLFALDTNSLKWRKIQTSGDVPADLYDSAFVTVKDVIYIYGGMKTDVGETGSRVSNDIYSMSLEG